MPPRRTTSWTATAGALLSLLSATGAAAAPGRPLEFDNSVDAQRVLALGAGTALLKYGATPPARCRICRPPAFDLSVAQTFGSRDHPELYAATSDWLLIGSLLAAPSALLLQDDTADTRLQDITIVTQATLSSYLLTVLFKLSSARQRPGFYLRGHRARLSLEQANLSFMSGHSSVTATLAASVATVAYLRGYAWRGVALGVGAVLATSVGVLRIAAQRHWLSDVLAGWLVGAAVGVLVPTLLHPRDRQRAAQAEPAPASLPLVTGRF